MHIELPICTASYLTKMALEIRALECIKILRSACVTAGHRSFASNER